MANQLTDILRSIRNKDYATATEGIAQVLQRKVEEHLAAERQVVGTTLVKEADDLKPGKCAKCGKPASWYHVRLNKKFCASCAPNDTMKRLQKEDTNSKPLECLECGKKFRSSSSDPKCPKCGGYDVDLAEGWADHKVLRHQCKNCGNIWMGPLSDHECSRCGASEYDDHKGMEEDCGMPHKGVK